LTSLIRQSEMWLTVTVAVLACAAACYFLWRRRRRKGPATSQPQDSARETCAVGAGDKSL
jgi:hypothetical protein